MKPHSRIDELLAHARRLVKLPSGNGVKGATVPVNATVSAGSAVPKGSGVTCSVVTKECVITVGTAHLQLRFFAEVKPPAGTSSVEASHMEALLPAINHCPAERVTLSRDHWKLLAHWLRGPKKRTAGKPTQVVQPSAPPSPQASSQGSAKKTAHPPDVAEGVGTRLYLLDAGKLYQWATNHWGSVAEMEAVCDAYRHNSTAWRQKHKGDWTIPERFLECLERLMRLPKLDTREPRIESASRGLPQINPPNSNEFSDVAYDECLEYAVLLEDVLFSWNSREQLLVHAEHLREILRNGTANLPTDLRLRRALELIEMRLHALLKTDEAPPKGAQPKQERIEPVQGSPPGCPEWPAEAEHSASVALSAEAFFHSTGMLKFMGYCVGKKSTLPAERRRAILAYVFLGKLPQVNDKHYMREWGPPRTNRRLRKLANTLAAFARNARRKQSKSWQKAIAEWEADLAYLKKRYYDRRVRDWKWPETVRHIGR